MFTADTLVTRFVFDDGYTAKANRATEATKKFGNAADDAKKKTKSWQSDMNKGFDNFYQKMSMGFDVASKFIGIMVGVGAAIVGASIAAAQKAAEFEALVKSLEAIEGGGKEAQAALKDLFELAKMPGLGRVEAVEGYRSLRKAGAGKEQAKEMIKQFGNANALAGGGREELGRVMLALQQMLNKPFLQGEELNQLTEAGVPAYKIMKDTFGTTDTEALKKAGIESSLVLEAITRALAEMPRVGNSAKNSIENFLDTVDAAFIGIGQGVIENMFGTFDEAVAAMTDLVDAGVFKTFGEAVAWQLNDALGMLNTGDIRKDLINVMSVVVDAAEKTKNFFMQIGEAIDVLWTLTKDILTLGMHRLVPGGSVDMGANAGSQFKENALKQLELYDKAKAQRDAERAKEAEAQQAKIDAGKADFDKRRQDALDKLTNPKKEDKATQHLANIDRNTKKLEDLTAMLMGGGAFTERHMNAYNLSRMTGGGGGAVSEARDYFMRGFEALERGMQGMLVDYNRQGHFRPS